MGLDGALRRLRTARTRIIFTGDFFHVADALDQQGGPVGVYVPIDTELPGAWRIVGERAESLNEQSVQYARAREVRAPDVLNSEG